MFKATAICHLIRSICIGKYALIMYYSMIWCMKYVNTNMICHLYNVQNQIVQSQHARSFKKSVALADGTQRRQAFVEDTPCVVTRIKPIPILVHCGHGWFRRKKGILTFRYFWHFKVASHHKSPVAGIVIVKFVVRCKSWLLPRKSNKSMRYAFLCGKISLWTYFATQWDDLATGRSMPSVPHCSFMAAIWPLIKGWAWRNHDGATRLLGLALSKTDWLLRQRARACLILPEDPCIVMLHPHEIGPNSPRSPFWRELLAAPGGTNASLAPGITTSFASLQLWTALPPSPLVQHQPGRPSLRMAPPTAWFMQKATAEKSSEGKKQTFPAMRLQWFKCKCVSGTLQILPLPPLPWPPISSPPPPFSNPSRPYVF